MHLLLDHDPIAKTRMCRLACLYRSRVSIVRRNGSSLVRLFLIRTYRFEEQKPSTSCSIGQFSICCAVGCKSIHVPPMRRSGRVLSEGALGARLSNRASGFDSHSLRVFFLPLLGSHPPLGNAVTVNVLKEDDCYRYPVTSELV